MEVSLKSVSSGLWWNGSAFAAAAEVFLTATGTGSWSFAIPVSSLVAGQSYLLRWRTNIFTGLSWLSMLYGSPLIAKTICLSCRKSCRCGTIAAHDNKRTRRHCS